MNMRRVIVVVLALLASSVVVGGLWVLLAPAPEIIVEESGSGRYGSESDPAKLFSAVATFAFLSFGQGVVIALVTWFGLRSSRGPGQLAFVTVMSVATSALALDIATRWGQLVRGTVDLDRPGAYRATVKLWLDSDVGQSWILLLCAPTAAVLVYVVCVVMSNHADLGVGDLVVPEPERVLVGADGASADGFTPVATGASDSAEPATGAGADGFEPITSEDEGPRTRP